MKRLCMFLAVTVLTVVWAHGNGEMRFAPSSPAQVTVEKRLGYKNLSPSHLMSMLTHKDFLLINVHIPYEGEIDKTDLFIPYNEIDQNLSKLPADRDAKIVLYCRTDRMSNSAAETLGKLGYTNVWNLVGGMVRWEREGYPLLHK